MKILIAIPCFDSMPVSFAECLLGLRSEGNDITVRFAAGSLIYDARNKLTNYAIDNGFDWVLWLDSDMVFPENALDVLLANAGDADLVTGMYVKRKPPILPVIYQRIEYESVEGGVIPVAEPIKEIPDKPFEIAGCGFGCVLTKVDLFKRIWAKKGLPFSPRVGFGEDLSFCLSASEVGAKMVCVPSLACGHVGQKVYTIRDFKEI